MTYKKKLTFLKDAYGWYADVPGHSRSQNSMVAHADDLCEALSNGKNRVSISLTYTDNPKDADTPTEYLAKCRRLLHDPFGGTYWVSGVQSHLFPFRTIWICNVTHDALPEINHPKYIYITAIEN